MRNLKRGYFKTFQSTLPRRERPRRPPHTAIMTDFNPRSREGSDPVLLFAVKLAGNFNPRSREGSDNFFDRVFYIFQNFNPRSREGSDSIY